MVSGRIRNLSAAIRIEVDYKSKPGLLLLTSLAFVIITLSSCTAGHSSGPARLIPSIIAKNPAGVRRALKSGADSNQKDKHGTPALVLAASMTQASIVRDLIAAGANVDAADLRGRTALMAVFASSKENKADADSPVCSIVAQLLKAEATVDKRNRKGNTAFMFAVWDGQIEVVKLLLEKGADPSAKEKDGNTALDHAVHYKKPDIARILRQHQIN